MAKFEITKKSLLTGVIRTQSFNMTATQYLRYMKGDELIQVVFPDYTADEREFLTSGITRKEWEDNMHEDDLLTEDYFEQSSMETGEHLEQS